ncbi:helix-turn-helix domain-containing protein [Streptomyces sp. NPDC005921]
MARARIVDPEEGPRSKRGAILVAAVERFGEDGYENTKWSEVADRVGIGQTALYHYFESRPTACSPSCVWSSSARTTSSSRPRARRRTPWRSCAPPSGRRSR